MAQCRPQRRHAGAHGHEDEISPFLFRERKSVTTNAGKFDRLAFVQVINQFAGAVLPFDQHLQIAIFGRAGERK